MKTRITILLSLLLAWGFLLVVPVQTVIATTTTDEVNETEVKAALIYKIARFVTWPDSSFEDKDSKFVVGVYEADDIQEHLEAILTARELSDRTVEVLLIEKVEDADTCHLLFVPGDASDIGALAKHLEGKPTLLMGESKKFATLGGHVNFYSRAGSIRFEMNPKAATADDLSIDSQILKLAKIVKD